jgi:spermidine synthase
LNASVAVSQLSNGVLNYHNAGKVQASSEPQDMRLQRMLGHLTTLIPEHARRCVVIGCGAGVTAGAVSIDPAVEHETIAEIEPLVPKVVSTTFAEHNFDVVRNPKVHVRIDDARHFFRRRTRSSTRSRPIRSIRGSRARRCSTRGVLRDGEGAPEPGRRDDAVRAAVREQSDAVKSEIATFLDAFPNGIVWGNTNEGKGYDLVLLGQAEPTKIDVDAIKAKLQRPEYATVQELAARDRHALGGRSLLDLRRPQARPRAVAAQRQPSTAIGISRCSTSRSRLNLYQADVIYADMLRNVNKLPQICSSDPRRRRTPCSRRSRAHRANVTHRDWCAAHRARREPREVKACATIQE